MTYPKYKDCDGNERQLDTYHLHELMDRVHLLQVTFESFVSQHPAACIEQGAIGGASDVLADLYRLIASTVERIEAGGVA